MMAVVCPGQVRQGQYLRQFFTLSSPGSRSPRSYFIAGVSGIQRGSHGCSYPCEKEQRAFSECKRAVNLRSAAIPCGVCCAPSARAGPSAGTLQNRAPQRHCCLNRPSLGCLREQTRSAVGAVSHLYHHCKGFVREKQQIIIIIEIYIQHNSVQVRMVEACSTELFLEVIVHLIVHLLPGRADSVVIKSDGFFPLILFLLSSCQ